MKRANLYIYEIIYIYESEKAPSSSSSSSSSFSSSDQAQLCENGNMREKAMYKSLKAQELRHALAARGLDTSGTRPVLVCCPICM